MTESTTRVAVDPVILDPVALDPVALDKEQLRATIADVLDVAVTDVTDDADFISDLDVDSLMTLEVVVVLEKRYGVRFEEAELRRVGSLDQAYRLLSAKLLDRA